MASPYTKYHRLQVVCASTTDYITNVWYMVSDESYEPESDSSAVEEVAEHTCMDAWKGAWKEKEVDIV